MSGYDEDDDHDEDGSSSLSSTRRTNGHALGTSLGSAGSVRLSQDDEPGAGEVPIKDASADSIQLDFGMTDLEDIFNSPEGPAVRKVLIERFTALEAGLASQIKEGADTDMFQRAKIIRNSLAAARDFMLRYG